MGFLLQTLLLLYAVIGNIGATEKIIACYYGSWATYREGLGKFDVANINADLCTHIIYTFVAIDYRGSVTSLDNYLDLEDGKDNFRRFNALKQKNPKLKTILAVGGWNEGSHKYSTVVANPALRQNFVTTAVKIVLDYGFDGFDLDWEYPNKRDTAFGSADIDNFSQLVMEMKEEFDKHGLSLSAAVAATRDTAGSSYDIPTISKYLDFINIMTYDMHVGTEPRTGHNAPLHKSLEDKGEREDLYTVDVAIEYWIKQGCPPEKILLGIPFYGRSFTLSDLDSTSVGAPSSGPGTEGPYTVTNGFLGYNEICIKLLNLSWTTYRDEYAKVPYAVQYRDWVSYDDSQSITDKVNFSKDMGLAGVMVWSIETDDFRGLCGEKYALLKAINKAFDKTTESSTKLPELVTTHKPGNVTSEVPDTIPSEEPIGGTHSATNSTSTTTSISSNNTKPMLPEETNSTSTPKYTQEMTDIPNSCIEEGITFNPDDCGSFIICVRGFTGKFEAYVFHCPKDLLWDIEHDTCNYPDRIECAS